MSARNQYVDRMLMLLGWLQSHEQWRDMRVREVLAVGERLGLSADELFYALTSFDAAVRKAVSDEAAGDIPS